MVRQPLSSIQILPHSNVSQPPQIASQQPQQKHVRRRSRHGRQSSLIGDELTAKPLMQAQYNGLETEDIDGDDDDTQKGINNVVCYQSVSQRREVFPKLITNLNQSPGLCQNEETQVFCYTNDSPHQVSKHKKNNKQLTGGEALSIKTDLNEQELPLVTSIFQLSKKSDKENQVPAQGGKSFFLKRMQTKKSEEDTQVDIQSTTLNAQASAQNQKSFQAYHQAGARSQNSSETFDMEMKKLGLMKDIQKLDTFN